jgi:hypothetical protein
MKSILGSCFYKLKLFSLIEFEILAGNTFIRIDAIAPKAAAFCVASCVQSLGTGCGRIRVRGRNDRDERLTACSKHVTTETLKIMCVHKISCRFSNTLLKYTYRGVGLLKIVKAVLVVTASSRKSPRRGRSSGGQVARGGYVVLQPDWVFSSSVEN